jgi:DNA-binding response OmpR family regulator
MTLQTTPPTPVRPCLLLVDDTPANIDVLVGLLKADYDLKIANRGDRALKILEGDARIDLVLLDIMMPGMDGYEVCRCIRAMPSAKDVPVLFLTAKGELDDIVRGFDSGGNDYITKPFRPQELLSRVRTHVTVQAQRQEIADKNTELKEMLQIVCHDIANHFMVLSMSMTLIEEDPTENFQAFMPNIKAAIRNGINLTELVRELRRSEDKPLKLQSVPVRSALDESLLILNAKIRAKNLSVSITGSSTNVMAEPCALINSVFNNILSNAIKFSHDGGKIDIAIRAENGKVEIRFRDHGVGMPADILEHLFDVGRSHGRAGTAGERGTGFGMPLMHRFMERFGGAVEVVSHETSTHPDDHGTEICLRLAPAAAV